MTCRKSWACRSSTSPMTWALWQTWPTAWPLCTRARSSSTAPWKRSSTTHGTPTLGRCCRRCRSWAPRVRPCPPSTVRPPNLFNEIKGDAFAPRNKHALAIDFVAEPPFFQVSETHAAKTWYLDPRAPKMERPHSIQNLREKMGKMGGSNFNG